MRNKPLLTAIAVAGLNSAVMAASPVIVVGQSNILPNQANQQVQVLISGTDLLAGADLYVQLDLLSGQCPAITNVNVLSGTIFASNHTVEKDKFVGTGTMSNYATIGTTTASGTVTDSGVLVTLTLNTTGLSAGVFHLNMSDLVNGPSDLVLENHAALAQLPGAPLLRRAI